MSFPAIRAIRSGSARLRVQAVRDFLLAQPPDQEVLLVGASRGAVDDCARAFAAERGVSFGLHRYSVVQLAARIATVDLASHSRTPLTRLGFEALATRATFGAVADGALGYLDTVHMAPGFPRALAATLTELRMRRATAADLQPLDRGGSDLAALLARVEEWMDRAGMSDRATLFETALAKVRSSPDFVNVPVVLLDVPFDSPLASEFLFTLARRAPSALITVADGDQQAVRAIDTAGLEIEDRHEPGDTDLTRLQQQLFAEAPPDHRLATGEMVWLSAPGEARECVEIARRVLNEAAAGVRFDEMAVLLRSPQQYIGLLEHAFDRAGIPAYFDRGTRRPDPAGRAFLALLASAVEGLSARRFAEYLSLGQVPLDNRVPADDTFTIPADEGFGLVAPDRDDDELAAEDEEPDRRTPRLSAPWRWERLLVESSVIGSADRWRRRLDGLASHLRARIASLQTDDPDDPRIDALSLELDDLGDLQAFALPLIQEMAQWPARARWGEWMAALSPFARRVLRQPQRVVQILASLGPMAEVGPVSLAEVHAVLAPSLSALYDPPATPRYGRVFVADLAEARGRSFRAVFVPGLAERLFPRVIREDPLLGDDLRVRIRDLVVADDRAALERLALRLAAGAASDRLYVSFPRLDATGGRARVPSFYALELIRAVTGQVPDSTVLQQAAADASGAALAWPAPRQPAAAIDDFEHDLSMLRGLMAAGASGRGRAHYIVQLNPHLRQSLKSQYQRARPIWTSSDGIVRATGEVRGFLDTQRLHARPYSVSALQHYAACPYRFLLSAIYRLAPIEAPEPLQRLDPLTRGTLVHRVQAETLRELAAASLLGTPPADRHRLIGVLDRTLARVAAEFADRLAPAIDRVWQDEIAAIGRDLHVWLDQVWHDRDWEPWRFELSFGLSERDGHDDHSRRDPVFVNERFLLRGSVDLIERRRGAERMRVTDYKTSRNRLDKAPVVGGGAVLQPVLYSLAVEAMTGLPVESARLWYCTSAGGFSEHAVPISDASRQRGLEVLEIVDRAVELGILPASPREGACVDCDFRLVCGPNEEWRVRHKPRELVGDLTALREMK
jgi:ATP-dependent helicase/nuclease subunit B